MSFTYSTIQIQGVQNNDLIYIYCEMIKKLNLDPRTQMCEGLNLRNCGDGHILNDILKGSF